MIIIMYVLFLLLTSSGIAMNVFDREELSIKFEIEDNVLIADWLNNRTIEIDNNGNIIWEKTNVKLPQDVERLSNGNTLITEYGRNRVIEIDISGNIVWEKTDLLAPMDAERLPNGNTLITEYDGDRVIEVDDAGNIIWEKTELDDPFDAERLSNGNTLIAETPYPIGRIIEVDKAGDIIWNKSGFSGPVDVERLSNGNTLITEHIGKRVIEIDNAGNIIWEKTDLNHPKDAERLPNGNTLIADCSANRVIEVDNAGNIVWEKTGLHYPTDVESLFNLPPNPPNIKGTTTGRPGKSYDYKFNSVDLNDDKVRYHIDWNDSNSEVTAFNPSGMDVTVSHIWINKGTYVITVYAEDEFGFISSNSILEITMQKNKAISLNLFLQRFFQRFPLFEKILNQIII